MRMLFDYLRLFLFTAGVLLGLQAPGFVAQYGSRLEARMLESKQSLQVFQISADKHFDGDMVRLITHYKNKSDQVVQDGGHSIEALYERNQSLISAYRHFSRNELTPFIHTFLRPLKDVRENTLKNYNFVVLLNTTSVIWGIAVGLCLITLSGLIFRILRLTIRPFRRRPARVNKVQLIEPDMGL